MRFFLLFVGALVVSNTLLGCTSEDCGGVDPEEPPQRVPISISLMGSRPGAVVSTSGQCTQPSCSYESAGQCTSWSAELTSGTASSCTVIVTDSDGNQESQPATASADGCTGTWESRVEFSEYTPGSASSSSSSGGGGAAGSGGMGGSSGGSGGAGGAG